MSKTLVAYFSASGTTAKAAKSLADAANADLYEIRPAVPYTNADLNWMDICQFAEIMERNGSEYAPVEPETVQTEEQGQRQEEKKVGLELKTQFGITENVTLTVNTYDNEGFAEEIPRY